MPAPTPKHIQDKMIAAYLSGMTMAEAAASCGLSEKACFAAIRRNNVPRRAVHAPAMPQPVAPEETLPDHSQRIDPRGPRVLCAGFVYLFESQGEYKIGFSTNAEDRRKELEVELSRTIRSLWAFAHADAKRLEFALHRRFHPKRIRKEWFALSAEDVRWLESLDAATADALVAKAITKRERREKNGAAIREQSQTRVIETPLDCRTRDMTGAAFGRLTVIRYAGRVVYGEELHGKGNRAAWRCRCSCGTEKVIVGESLRKGATMSCGCLLKERAAKKCYRHGKSRSSEYAIWQCIKRRCLPVEQGGHRRYGGRGITVCDRWRDSFDAFLADLGPRPSPDHSVERREIDESYCPENCFWATREQQNRNKSTTHLITLDGETLCITDWARRIGIHPVSLHYRITKYNWSIRKALTTPKY